MLRSSEKEYIYPIVAFVLGAFLVALLLDQTVEMKDYVASIATLFAAFFGATLAFKLNDNKEKRKEYRNNKEAINFALFVLVRQMNAISITKKGYKKYENEFTRAFNLPAYKNNEYEDLKQDFNALAFILESDNPEILMELSIEQERFEQAMDSVRIRNEFYVNECQPLMSHLGLNGKKLMVEEMAAALGERVFSAAMQGAENMVDHVEKCDASIPEMHSKLFELARELFPGHKFVKWEKQA